MKRQNILRLALVLCGGLWIWLNWHEQLAIRFRHEFARSHPPVRFSPEGTWSKKLKTPWTDAKIVLYRPSGEAVQIDARRAVYTVQSIRAPQSKGFDSTVIAFIDPETRNVWIGQDTESVETNEFIAADHTIHTNYLTYTNLYVENGSEILSCGSVLLDGALDSCESVIKKAQLAENLDSVIGRYDNNADTAWPLYGATWESAFNDGFREDFFSSGNVGSQTTQISGLAVADGKIRLQFYSLKYRTTGSVWLDLNTLKVLKTGEHM